MTHSLPIVDLAASLPISETFTSIQGEGKLTGTPSHFIRLSGCNLRCSWCDTPYASWSPESTSRTIGDLVEQAQAAEVQHVVVTGGEPMMFNGVTSLCQTLRAAQLHVTIETAGTLTPPKWGSQMADLMSLSPKLSNSTPQIGDIRDPDQRWRERHEARRLNLPVLRTLLEQHPDHQLKFVVASPVDLAEIDDLIAELGPERIRSEDVMLMPEGVQVPAPEKVEWIRNVCDTRGWTYCKRLHIELFGDTRGT